MYILVDSFEDDCLYCNVYVTPVITPSVFTAYTNKELRIFSILDKENPVEFTGSSLDDLESAEAWTPVEEWVD
jgi:hypothetical protein